MTEERLARAGLSRLAEPGDVRVARAVAHAGAAKVYEEILAHRADHDLSADAAGRVAVVDPAADLELAERRGIRFVIPGDAEWPAQLDDLAHSGTVQEMGGVPVGLWARGPLRLDELADSVAVVGSRSATTYGEEIARDIAAGVARAGRCLVSGAAYGIDQAAHRGALAAGGTSVAVLACGVDRPYPLAHRSLIDHMAQFGAVVSELPPGCAPMRMRFLARNRVIAALTCGTVLVEAALRSGALNTTSWASGLCRPVMGVPGPLTSAQSQGVHQLMRNGGASLVTGPGDVLEQVAEAGEHLVEVPRGPERPRDRLTRRHHQVLEAVPVHRPAGLTAIAATAGIGLRDTQTALDHLVARGFVAQGPLGWRLGERARCDVPVSGT